MEWVVDRLLDELRRERWAWEAGHDGHVADVWARRMAPVPGRSWQTWISGRARQAWLLRGTAWQERPLDEYARFQATQLERRWDSQSPWTPPGLVEMGRPSTIGLALIAPIRGTRDWMLEFQFQDVFAEAYRYEIDEAALSVERVEPLALPALS